MADQKRLSIEQRFNGIVVFFYCFLIVFLPVSIALVETMAAFVIFFFVIKKILLNAHDLKTLYRSAPGHSWPVSVRLVLSSLAPSKCYLNWPMGLFIGFVFISVLQSRFFETSMIAFVAKLLEGYFLYFSFVDCVTTKRSLKIFLGAYLASVTLMAVNGLTQYFTQTDFLRGTTMMADRVSSSLRHANDFGAYLILAIPIVFGVILLSARQIGSLFGQWADRGRADQILKYGLFVLFAALLACLGLTFSRGSWVGFFVSLLVFAIVWRKHYFFVALVGVVFLAVFMQPLVKTRDVSFLSDNVKLAQDYVHFDYTQENLDRLDSHTKSRALAARSIGGMGRDGFWNEATSMIKKRPLWGSGLNTYSKYVPRYPHNCYLQMAAEIGILGLLAFLVMICSMFWQTLKQVSSVKDPFLQVVLAGATAGLAGFLVQSFFDTTLYSVQLGNLMWVFMGIIVATQRLSSSAE